MYDVAIDEVMKHEAGMVGTWNVTWDRKWFRVYHGTVLWRKFKTRGELVEFVMLTGAP